MLIGCTGVEDKLQDDVPETLTALRDAGIQVRYPEAYLLQISRVDITEYYFILDLGANR